MLGGKCYSLILKLPRLDGWSEDEIMSWTPDNYEKELVKRTWSDDFDFLYDLGGAIYTVGGFSTRFIFSNR